MTKQIQSAKNWFIATTIALSLIINSMRAKEPLVEQKFRPVSLDSLKSKVLIIEENDRVYTVRDELAKSLPALGSIGYGRMYFELLSPKAQNLVDDYLASGSDTVRPALNTALYLASREKEDEKNEKSHSAGRLLAAAKAVRWSFQGIYFDTTSLGVPEYITVRDSIYAHEIWEQYGKDSVRIVLDIGGLHGAGIEANLAKLGIEAKRLFTWDYSLSAERSIGCRNANYLSQAYFENYVDPVVDANLPPGLYQTGDFAHVSYVWIVRSKGNETGEK